MTELLTPTWAEIITEQLTAVDPGPGGSGVVEWVVSGGDPGRMWVRWDIADGRITDVSVLDAPGPDDEVEVTVPLSRVHAESVLTGEIDPAQAYMRGDLKPEGSSRAWFALLSVFARPDVRKALSGS